MGTEVRRQASHVQMEPMSLTIEKNGWRLETTQAGQISSFTNGTTELINSRLRDNRPRVVVGDVRRYDCQQPNISRRQDGRLIFRYDFAGRESS